MCSGPIASALVNAFGLRIVTITGGVIACVGLVVSTFTPPNFWLFILTFGVLTGELRAAPRLANAQFRVLFALRREYARDPRFS